MSSTTAKKNPRTTTKFTKSNILQNHHKFNHIISDNLNHEDSEIIFEANKILNKDMQIVATTTPALPTAEMLANERKSFHSFAPNNDYVVCEKQENFCQNHGLCYRAKAETRIDKSAPNYKFCV